MLEFLLNLLKDGKIIFFSKSLFNKFNYTYPQNKETQKHLKKLGVKILNLLEI